MRGEHLDDLMQSAVEKGITPACAGNTEAFGGAAVKVEDHPRMRGEHAKNYLKEIGYQGSPPHARGTRSMAPAR